MKKRIVFTAILALAAMFACDDPPTITKTGLEGNYRGTYAYIFNPGDGPDTMLQAVRLHVSSGSFVMYADTTDPLYDSTVCFCIAMGPYTVTDRVNLTDPGEDPIPDNCETCNPEWSPYGAFVLEQPSGGLKLTMIDSAGPEGITKQLVLMKLGDI